MSRVFRPHAANVTLWFVSRLTTTQLFNDLVTSNPVVATFSSIFLVPLDVPFGDGNQIRAVESAV